jgi:hypothetical protein
MYALAHQLSQTRASATLRSSGISRSVDTEWWEYSLHSHMLIGVWEILAGHVSRNIGSITGFSILDRWLVIDLRVWVLENVIDVMSRDLILIPRTVGAEMRFRAGWNEGLLDALPWQTCPL